jgi:hypothetical protein
MLLLGWLPRLKQHDDIYTWYSSIFLLSACPHFYSLIALLTCVV